MEIIAARYVFPIASDPIFQGAVVLQADQILDVGPLTSLKTKYPDATLHKFDEHALLPGLVNADACLQMAHFEPEEWPESYIAWQIAGLEFRRSQSAVKRRAAILDGLQNSLAHGVTCVADTGNYEGILQIVQDTGLRLHISPEVAAGEAPGQETFFDQALGMVEAIQAIGSDRVHAGLAPLSPYALSRQLLKILAQHARQAGITIKTRAAESFAEMEFFHDSKGEIADTFFPQIGWTEELPPAQRKTPIEYLESIDFLQENTGLVGCNHLSEEDQQRIAAHKSHAIATPNVARSFGLGNMPAKKLRQQKISVGLATGSLGTRSTHSLWDEMRAAQTLFSEHPRDALSPEDLLRMATLESAEAIGLSGRIGSLESGKQADFILVETNSRLPIEEIPAALIGETQAARIAKVYVNGVCLK